MFSKYYKYLQNFHFNLVNLKSFKNFFKVYWFSQKYSLTETNN